MNYSVQFSIIVYNLYEKWELVTFLLHAFTTITGIAGSWPSIGKVIPEGNIPFKIIIKASSQVNYSIERLDNGQVTTGIVANSVSKSAGAQVWADRHKKSLYYHVK